MSEPDTRYWLEGPEGACLRVEVGGVLLGRASSSDLVINDTRASNRHALIRLGPAGLELVQLGRNATYVNKERVEGATVLHPGDRVEVPGLKLHVRMEGTAPTDTIAWVLCRSGGEIFGIHRAPFRVGSGPDDHLRLTKLSPSAVIFHKLHGSLLLEATVLCTLDGEEVDLGDLRPLHPGSVVELAGERLEILAEGPADEVATLAARDEALADAVVYEDLPEGGDLSLAFGSRTRTVRLDEPCGRLIAALLSPPAPLEAGDLVPDEQLIALVWPGDASRDAAHLELLLVELRHALLEAGVNPFSVLARARGEAMCVRLARSAPVQIR